jgi:hypothetical protein
MSTIRVTTIATQAGVEVYTCKAWVNFNGTGTVAINGSGNVSSITDNGTGAYTVNFTVAMPDVNYAVVITNEETGTEVHNAQTNAGYDQTTSAAKLRCNLSGTSTNYDPNQMHCAIFR